MQIGKLAYDVRIMTTGFTREAGGTIAENEVPPAVWKKWVAEGIVVFPKTVAMPSRERRARRRRDPAIR